MGAGSAVASQTVPVGQVSQPTPQPVCIACSVAVGPPRAQWTCKRAAGKAAVGDEDGGSRCTGIPPGSAVAVVNVGATRVDEVVVPCCAGVCCECAVGYAGSRTWLEIHRGSRCGDKGAVNRCHSVAIVDTHSLREYAPLSQGNGTCTCMWPRMTQEATLPCAQR